MLTGPAAIRRARPIGVNRVGWSVARASLSHFSCCDYGNAKVLRRDAGKSLGRRFLLMRIAVAGAGGHAKVVCRRLAG